MAEEGVTGGGGAQSINVGVKVENNSAVEEIKKLSKEVEALKGKLHGVADASGKANAGVTGMGQQKGSIYSLGGSFRALGEQIGSALTVGAALSGALQLIKADMANLAATAKDASGQRQAYAQASNGNPAVAQALRQQLQGTAFGGAEGAALVADATSTFPKEMLEKRTAEVAAMFKQAQQASGSLGVGPGGVPVGAAGLVKTAGYIEKKMNLPGSEAVKFAALLKKQGLSDINQSKEAINKLIGAGMDPEEAFLFAAYAQNTEGGNEAMGGLASLFDKSSPEDIAAASKSMKGQKIITPEQAMTMMTPKQRFDFLERRPDAFGVRGQLWAKFRHSPRRGREAADANWNEMLGAQASTQDSSMAQAEVEMRAQDEAMNAAESRDSTMFDFFNKKLAEKYKRDKNPIAGKIAQAGYYARYVLGGDPIEAAMEVEPSLGGLAPSDLSTARLTMSGEGLKREQSRLRSKFLSGAGLAGASGEAQPTQRVEVVATVRTDKGNRVAVQSQPSVGGGS